MIRVILFSKSLKSDNCSSDFVNLNEEFTPFALKQDETHLEYLTILLEQL